MTPLTRERLGASTGLIAALLFAISFVIGISPERPDFDASAGEVASFVAANQDALRVEILLNTLAVFFFLWFLGSIRAGLRGAEGGVGRVSAIASGGGIVGATMVLVAQVFAAVATLRPEETDPGVIRALVDLQLISIGLGAAAFAVFFLAIAVASYLDGGLPGWLTGLSALAALTAVVGVVTIFSVDGVFAADGAIGFWVRLAVFVGWLAIASLALVTSVTGRRRR